MKIWLKVFDSIDSVMGVVLCCVVLFKSVLSVECVVLSSSSTEFGVESEFLCFTTSKIRRWFHRKLFASNSQTSCTSYATVCRRHCHNVEFR